MGSELFFLADPFAEKNNSDPIFPDFGKEKRSISFFFLTFYIKGVNIND
jgi:hypothetical protein